MNIRFVATYSLLLDFERFGPVFDPVLGMISYYSTLSDKKKMKNWSVLKGGVG